MRWLRKRSGEWIKVDPRIHVVVTHPPVEYRPNPWPAGSYLAAQWEVAQAGRNLARQVAWNLGLYRLADWLARRLG